MIIQFTWFNILGNIKAEEKPKNCYRAEDYGSNMHNMI